MDFSPTRNRGSAGSNSPIKTSPARARSFFERTRSPSVGPRACVENADTGYAGLESYSARGLLNHARVGASTSDCQKSAFISPRC